MALRQQRLNRRDVMVTCRDCGDVLVPANRCQLRHCQETDTFSLAYRCGDCDVCDCVEYLYTHEVKELLEAGFKAMDWRLPKEPEEPHFQGPDFTPDDLLDFHFFLRQPLEEWGIFVS
jgi:hypothetical protein